MVNVSLSSKESKTQSLCERGTVLVPPWHMGLNLHNNALVLLCALHFSRLRGMFLFLLYSPNVFLNFLFCFVN